MSQDMHKQNPTNAKMSKADGVQQVQHKEQYMWLQVKMKYQLH